MAVNINLSLDPSRVLPKIDEVSATEVYFGYAELGTKDDDGTWRVVKMSKSGNVTSFLYPDGDITKKIKWTDRATQNFTR